MHLPGRNRAPHRDDLPPREHRVPPWAEAEVGPGEGAVHRRREGEPGTVARTPRRLGRIKKSSPPVTRGTRLMARVLVQVRDLHKSFTRGTERIDVLRDL